jgi:hypothetical protein
VFAPGNAACRARDPPILKQSGAYQTGMVNLWSCYRLSCYRACSSLVLAGLRLNGPGPDDIKPASIFARSFPPYLQSNSYLEVPTWRFPPGGSHLEVPWQANPESRPPGESGNNKPARVPGIACEYCR